MENSTPNKQLSLSISSPEDYPSFSLDENGKRKTRLAYQVTGNAEAIKQYNEDMIARNPKGVASIDKVTGNPLFTASGSALGKIGAGAVIVRASKPDDKGHYGWFVDTTESKLIDEAMATASEGIKQAHALAEYSKLIGTVKQMVANKRAKQSVSVEAGKADLSK